MSTSNSILKLLNIKDKNIIVEDDFYEHIKIKGVITKVISATLTHDSPNVCPCCKKYGAKIIKHGFKSSLIKLPALCEFNAYIRLKKQRFICCDCKKTFTASNTIAASNCQISNDTKLLILKKATQKISEKDIAMHFNVSQSYVNKILYKAYSNRKINKNYLPKHLSFDEFKSCKDSTYAMSFIFIDATNSKIVDIVQVRKLNSLIAYFRTFSAKARATVKLYALICICLI